MKEIKVTSAKVLEFNGNKSTVFSMTVNDVTIYNCRMITGEKNGKPYELVGFPSEKGKDGKYYNRVWCRLETEDIANIKTQIMAILCPM